VEAFGPGGGDVGGGEYEEILDQGGDEEDAYVIKNMGRISFGRGLG